MPKASKQFKKFAASGKLKETIKKRRSHQQSKRKFDERVTNRQKHRGAPRDEGLGDDDDEEGDGGDEKELKKASVGGRAGGVAKTVDELFAGFAGSEDGMGDEEDDSGSELEDEGGDEDDEESVLEEGLERDEEAMRKAMQDLEKKDPEFYKYLKDNDRNLLDFEGGDVAAADEDEDMAADDSEDMDVGSDEEDDEDGAEMRKVVVTSKMLRQWQEAMLRLHSINSLRNVILAFRSAAHMNEEESQGAGATKFTINSPSIFNKLVVTALKFTPVVLQHHMPAKVLANGRFKVAQPKTPNVKLNRLILSHFSTLLFFIRSLPARPASTEDEDDEGAAGLLLMALSESAKLVPWVLSARKHVKAYLKVLLELWGSAADNVRIAAFLATRKMFVGGDDAIKDMCLKSTYRALLPPLRNTTPHTLPSINLLKNTASELFLLSPALSYPHAFTAIRMLAVHLRDCIRGVTSAPSTKTQRGRGEDGDEGGRGKGKKKDTGSDAFRKVYNWQFVHCIDFWCKTLGAGCSVEREKERGGVTSELEPLIYPLVQIALGVIRLFPNSRYFPLHLHLLHSLLHLIRQTGVYIPLTPYLLAILSSAEFRSSRPRASTLKPLDLEYIIRAPQAYPKTRIYQESIAEELTFLLAEYHACLSTSIAFPEISLPVVLTIRRLIKKDQAGSVKCQQGFKVLVEKIELSRKWVEEKRRNVSFAPRDRGEVNRFCEDVDVLSTPVGSWVKVQRKTRERKRREVERALRGEKDD